MTVRTTLNKCFTSQDVRCLETQGLNPRFTAPSLKQSFESSIGGSAAQRLCGQRPGTFLDRLQISIQCFLVFVGNQN